MLGQRILTAVGLVTVLALILLVLPPPFALAALGLLILAGAWEWSLLAGIERPLTRAAYLAACVAAMAGLWQVTALAADFERAMVVTMLGWIVLFLDRAGAAARQHLARGNRRDLGAHAHLDRAVPPVSAVRSRS